LRDGRVKFLASGIPQAVPGHSGATASDSHRLPAPSPDRRWTIHGRRRRRQRRRRQPL